MDNEVTLPHATVKQIIQKSLNPAYKSSAAGLTTLISELSQGICKSRFYLNDL